MAGVSPVSEYIVVALPVFATSAVQVVPPSVDLSTLYPVMAEPPLSVGGAQLKLICEEDTAVAVSPVRGDAAYLFAGQVDRKTAGARRTGPSSPSVRSQRRQSPRSPSSGIRHGDGSLG